MEPQTPKSSNSSIPLAIIVAGLIIAGAIYLKDKRVDLPVTPPEQGAPVSRDMIIPALASTDHLEGNPNAPVIFFEYSDFDCPFCRTFYPVTQQLLNTYGKDGKMSLVYRHFPLNELHPNAHKKAEASECANELGGSDLFWKFSEALFKGAPAHGNDPTPELVDAAKKLGLNETQFKSCLTSGRYIDLVDKQYNDAVSSGGRGTPYNILAVNKKITEEMEAKFASIFAKYPSGTYTVSTDRMRLALNGALSFDSIKQAMDLLTAGK